MNVLVIVLLGIAIVALVVLWTGHSSWERETEASVDRLARAASPLEASYPSALETTDLPAPVTEYFRYAFVEPGRPTQMVRLTQTGTFRTGSGDAWRPFTAIEHVSLEPPGFVWDARIAMAPGMPVRVRDTYVAGKGSMRGKLLALVSVVDEHDKKELSQGALLRYLAEGAWFPEALLPSSRMSWRAVDETTAEATLTDGEIEVSARFRFDATGAIAEVEAQRYREVDGRYVLTPWRGRFGNYARFGSVLLPKEGEVGWVLPDAGEFAYFRGTIGAYESLEVTR